MNAKDFLEKTDKYYMVLNKFISTGDGKLIRMTDNLYPDHDGEENADYAATLMLIRDFATEIQWGINNLINTINIALKEDEEEATK